MKTIPLGVLSVALAIGANAIALSIANDEPAPGRASESPDSADEKPRTERDKWMHAKLRASEQIFEALTKGDTTQIAANARRMLLLNFLEQWKDETKFKNQSDYDAQLNAFEYATKELVRTGHQGDVNGAMESYLMLTRSCVRCHQLVRDSKEK